MEVLDTTIANVALRYIAGGISAAVTDSEWVITSYLAANECEGTSCGTLKLHHKATGLQHRFSRKASCNRILERFLLVE
jgi:hypothetical protein